MLIIKKELTNTSIDFQRFINDVLHHHLDLFCTTYIDDVLIYSSFLSEHKRYVRAVIEALAINELHIKSEKCEFYKTEVKYLDLIILKRGIIINPTKVDAVT